MQEMEDKSNNEYRSYIKTAKSYNCMQYHTKRKDRDNSQYFTQDFRNTDIDSFEGNELMLDQINDKMRSAERRTSECKQRISKVAHDFIDRVPMIQERFHKIQELIDEHKKDEFVKMFKKYTSSYKRKEKLMKDLREKK